MPRLFKDLLVEESDHKPRITLRNRSGGVVLEDVSVEVSSKILAPGDAWGALEANLLLDLSNDGVPTPRQDNPHKVTYAQTGAAAAAHNHDERYFTEDETTAKLNAKANTSGTYSGLSVGRATNADNAAKLGGKTLTMTLDGTTLNIDWR